MNLTQVLRFKPFARRIFRVVAVAEAISWALLLVGMYFKWIAETSEVGVQVFGPIHGTIFLIYVVVTFGTASIFGWNWKVTLLGLAAAIPPFATWAFEVWALRRGLLASDEGDGPAEPAAATPGVPADRVPGDRVRDG